MAPQPLPKGLLKYLADRWALLVEEDTQTDGFWFDVTTHFKREDQSELTLQEEAAARECVRRVAKHLRSYR